MIAFRKFDHGTWRKRLTGGFLITDGAPSFKQQGKMTEYEKLELLHSQLDELINGNQLPVDELKILQSFVEDIREKHLTSNKLDKLQAPGYNGRYEKENR